MKISKSRINNVFKRWKGQYVHFSKKLAIYDMLLSTVFRNSNSELTYNTKIKFYDIAKSILKERYQCVIDKWNRDTYSKLIRIDEESYIFVLWWQGEDQMPSIVQECVSSIKKHSAAHKVIILTKNNWSDWCDIPRYILNKLHAGQMTVAQFSDILRSTLIYKYGGFWVDSTILMSNEFENNIYDRVFYTIRHGEEHQDPICKGLWSGFFLAAGQENPFLGFMQDMFFEYWKKENNLLCYLLIDCIMAIGYENITVIKKMVDDVPINNIGVFDLLNSKQDILYSQKIYAECKERAYLHKLTYKQDYNKSLDNKTTIYGKISENN